jgi:hypothetical protein
MYGEVIRMSAPQGPRFIKIVIRVTSLRTLIKQDGRSQLADMAASACRREKYEEFKNWGIN